MTEPMPPVPQPSGTTRVQAAVSRRGESDYLFSFWTALGWTILTCGIYGLYVTYRLFWRSVEHNRRRIELLDTAQTLAWERAVTQGRGDELTPQFQLVGQHLAELRRLAGEFRDPAVWTIICAISSGIGQIVGQVFLDMDLVRHETHERAAEQHLAAIYLALGAPVSLPPAGPVKGRHSYGGRIAALLLTCGIYGLWWLYDLMVEGNRHLQADWASDDAWWSATAALAG